MSHGHFDRNANSLDLKKVRINNSSSKTSSYEKYKAELHAMFDGKVPMPDRFRVPVDSDETISDSDVKSAAVLKSRALRKISTPCTKGYDLSIEAIKRSSTPDEITRTIDGLIEVGFALPDDEDILSKGLSHRDEEVVMQILLKLEILLTNNSAKSPRLLRSRIENAALMVSSSKVQKLCQTLKNLI
ncbi:MAG: hypothetical protein O2897_02455 [bacterium]|nr:hypothetical protein [bacterium]